MRRINEKIGLSYKKLSMKILISSDVDNPYMDTLFYGLQNIGREHFFYKSSDLFWEKEAETYDIIHVMWAEDLIGWKLLKKNI